MSANLNGAQDRCTGQTVLVNMKATTQDVDEACVTEGAFPTCCTATAIPLITTQQKCIHTNIPVLLTKGCGLAHDTYVSWATLSVV